ncbi:MAG TPA: hypothetical protein VE825_09895 [Terriglobales bacterium]|nr:hypothetical protein [Terriglobales bacterium]
MAEILIYLAGGAALVLAWYFFFVRYNRARAIEVLRWIETSLAGHGHVTGIRWVAPSRFQVPIRLNTSVFRRPTMLVEITPREIPFRWLLDWLRKRPETVTFEADLDSVPGFNLMVRNHRWWGRTSRKLSPDPKSWVFDQTTPLLLTTRYGKRGHTTAMLNALFRCREKEFLKLFFRRQSPHFSATLPLEAVASANEGENLFAVLLEVASGASTSRESL